MSGKMTVVTDANYKEEVEGSSIPVLADFWAPWCGPCMALMPALEALAPMFDGRLKFVKINADENEALVEKFGVRGIPQLFLLKGGELVAPVKGHTRTRLALELEDLLA